MPPPLPTTRLVHIHIKPRIAYHTSLAIQDRLLNLHWEHRDTLKDSSRAQIPAPAPFLLSFSTHPTYTVGRRHLLANPLSSEQIAYLTSNKSSEETSLADFYPTSRGGLLTYHGPGQVTAYPIIDLRRFGLSARCYVRVLENAVSAGCNKYLNKGRGGSGRKTGRSETDPGVWMLEGEMQPSTEKDAPKDSDNVAARASDRKICALGVQVTRGVTAHGIGLNVRDEPIEANLKERFGFDDASPAASSSSTDYVSPAGKQHNEPGYLSWGFSRIVACGLEGKSTTWLTREGVKPITLTTTQMAHQLARNISQEINNMGNKEKFDNRQMETIEIEDPEEITALAEGRHQQTQPRSLSE